jgi:Na+-translocating ferredoxin:NAD+ oxidoreductase subunit D
MENKLYISSSPHIRGGASASRLMWTVLAALLPAAGYSIYLFGLPSLTVIVSCVLFAMLFEAAAQLAMKKPVSVQNGSAALSGLILALSLPPGLPIWICAVGSLVAVVIAKAVFGGLGQNPFNPAMTGRVFMLIAFPKPMTQWLALREAGEEVFQIPVTPLDAAGKVVDFCSDKVDVITAATPLGILTGYGPDAVRSFIPAQDLFFGTVNGSLGETSALLLLLGGLFLILTKVITWHIPVSCIAAVALFGGLFGLDSPGIDGAVFHVFSGAAILGAFFIATDYVTSPLYPKGKLIFGAGVGIFTMIIRLWAGYPEGVSFAVLLMNATVPLIDRYTKPKKFGFRPAENRGGK